MAYKYNIAIFIAILVAQSGHGQTAITDLSLDSAYVLLENRHPSLKDRGVINDLYQKERIKLNRSRLPEVYLKGDGRVQSESVKIDSPPDSKVPLEINLPLYSAKTYFEARYNILDGGVNKAQRKLKEIQLKSSLQGVEVKRYALREIVNQLFVNIAILRAQSKLFGISLSDLQARKKNVSAGVAEGILLEIELSKMRVKELEIKAQQDNINYKLSGFIGSLSDLLGEKLSDSISLKFPLFSSSRQIPKIERPEQKLFQLQQDAILANTDLIDAGRKPKLSAFAQGGVGYPNPLNFLNNSTAPYGVVGLHFNWKVINWKKHKLGKDILSLQAQKLQNARETFEFNLRNRKANYLAEISRLQDQLEKDKEIAFLQADILKQLAVQLDEGTITSTDYITQVNAELKARQNILIHQTELLKTQIEFWNERGGK